MLTFNPSPPAEEGRYGFGTTSAVDAMMRRLNLTQDTEALIAINIVTLIRNAVSNKSTTVQQVVDKVRNTMNSVANDLAVICQQKWADKKHHILFYMASSDKAIPVEYQRPRSSPTSNIIGGAIVNFIKTVKPGDQTVGNVTAHVRLANQMRVPSYKGLKLALSEMAPSRVPVHMISHMPMDYHVTFVSGRKGYLYRSHTGEVVDMSPLELGKIVFKNSDMPFYPITHLMLGDKYLIKPCLNKFDKNRLLDLCRSQHWSIHTAMFVNEKVKENKFVLPYKLDDFITTKGVN